MTVTAKTIARERQLSQPTVSRILSGDPRHRVSPQTKQRVLDTARRLGYQPNAVARSLRRGRTGIVGLYTNHDYDARNDFLGTIIGALQRCCEARDLDLLLHSGRGGRSAEEIYAKLRDGRVDGLILHANADDPLAEMLSRSPLPVVTVADRLPFLPGVTCDDAGGIRLALAHLQERGLRRFVFLAPEEQLTSVERRREAFESEMALAGVPASDWTVLRVAEDGYEAALARIQTFAPPCAAVCWCDRAAYRLLRVCRDLEIAVPETLSVTGFDGLLSDMVPAWDLVTVSCPWEEAAAQALDLLMTLVEDTPETLTRRKEICLPVRLCLGNTVR